jgi:hypothetical protein
MILPYGTNHPEVMKVGSDQYAFYQGLGYTVIERSDRSQELFANVPDAVMMGVIMRGEKGSGKELLRMLVYPFQPGSFGLADPYFNPVIQ